MQDQSERGSDGTIVIETMNGASPSLITDGREREALRFPSSDTDAHVWVPSLPVNLNAGSDNSISFWYRYSGDDVEYDMPVHFPEYDVYLSTRGDDTLCFNTFQSDCFGVRRGDLLDRWVHVVAVFHNGPITDNELYLDGQPQDLTCIAGACAGSKNVSTDFRMSGPGGNSFHGDLDEVRVYDRRLLADEIALLSANPSCR